MRSDLSGGEGWRFGGVKKGEPRKILLVNVPSITSIVF